MEEVTAGVYLVSINRSRYSAVYGGGHAKTAFLHAAISAAAHQNFISFTNVQFGICYDERSELTSAPICPLGRERPTGTRTSQVFVLIDERFNNTYMCVRHTWSTVHGS